MTLPPCIRTVPVVYGSCELMLVRPGGLAPEGDARTAYRKFVKTQVRDLEL